ncbi:PKD domain-containing protein [Hyalangium sp.]|uniref:PKD domain-containing protein n=1 Tax=Hyalangium sp. TaxID=2028555 RepID=UPI002D6B1A11|nr:PKD domain-containing protein [Hyalangium sp.]HYI02998.1 PKD domain-containing protein [Hyalangium sp.]
MAPSPRPLAPWARSFLPTLLLVSAACQQSEPVEPGPEPLPLAHSRQGLRPPIDNVGDLFLGQALPTLNVLNLLDERGLNGPDGIALDTSVSPPRVYVADTLNSRVLAWANALAFANGAPADKVIGQTDPYRGACNTTGVSAISLCSPRAVEVDGSGNLYVADTGNHRVLEFDTPFTGDLVADRVYGQSGAFVSGTCNLGGAPGPSTLCSPVGVAVDVAGNLYVSDQGNHRVLRFTSPLADAVADAVLGQTGMTGSTPNLVDARGLANPSRLAIDRSVTPNRIYVADTDNHRVLGWSSATGFANGATADRVLGQPDASATGCNTGGVGAGTLCFPRGLAVDAAGNLYVADANNNRVLVFDTPLTSDALADKVWGQATFTGSGCNSGGVGAGTLCSPWEVLLDTAGNLHVADTSNNRVLSFTGGRAGDTTADRVYGQASFTAVACNTGGRSSQTLCSPRGLAFDASGNLFVADHTNSRVLVYTPLPVDTVADRVFGQATLTAGSCNAGGVSGSSLCNPGSVAVDSAGNVWVGDEGNSRVLGYLAPLTTNTVADRVVGKSSLTSNSCLPASATCIATSPPAVAVDASDNLYVADPAGNRVLAYNAPFATNTTADRILGQADFSTTSRNSIDAQGLSGPEGLHVDRSSSPNRLYVADAQNSRVLAWDSVNLINGQPADRIFGQATATQGTCNGSGLGAQSLCLPVDVATDTAGNVYITDDTNSRVLEYNAPFATGGDVVADRVFGQTGFTGSTCNSGGTSGLTLCNPRGLTVSPSGHVYVVDGGNHRLLRYDMPLSTDLVADAVLGQIGFRNNGANLVDGAGMSSPYAVAIDTSATPNRLYVADSTNSRVLAWADVTAFQNGSPADLVLGQPDLFTSDCNSQGLSASSLCDPSAIAVDATGRVYVADSSNDRVLIYEPPFATDTVADKVVGQASFTNGSCNRGGGNPSAITLCDPHGVAVSPAMDLFVSDESNHRVLVYTNPWGTDSTADAVFGQAGSFTTRTCNRGGRSESSLCDPGQIALDTTVAALRLYVADSTNNRVLVYDAPRTSDTTADLVIGQSGMTSASCGVGLNGLCDPKSVAVDATGNVYVVDNDNDRVVQYNAPRTTDTIGDRLFGQSSPTGSSCNAGGLSASSLCGPRGVAVDAVGSLYVADTTNHRVVVYLANNRPTANPLTLTPPSPRGNDNLVGSYSYQDVDGDVQNGTEVRWYRDGQEQAAWFGQLTVQASATTRGEQWYFTVRPRDGVEYGRLERSLTVTILNTPPVASTPSIAPAAPRTNDILSASYGYTDADTDTESGSEIHWFLNNVEQPALLNQPTVPASATFKGQLWYFTVRPSDGSELGAAMTSPVVTIANTSPSAGSVQIIPASPSSTSNLSVSYTYADPDGDAELGSEIRWYRNGALQASLNDLRTVSGPLTLNDQWHYTLRPRDGADLGALATSTTVVVGSSAPTATNVQITPSPPRTHDVLTASYTYSDPDSQGETGSQIRWFKNTVAQPAYNNLRTVPASATTKGDSWYFTVQPCDSTPVCGLTQTAPTATVLNTAPSATAPAIAPASPRTTDTLTAGYTYADADSDTESGSEIRWFRNGVEQTALANQRTLPAGIAAKGQSWAFTVRPRDGVDFGAAMSSAPVTIANSAPTATQVVLTPPTPRVTDTLTATYRYTDADGDTPAAPTVRWYRNTVEDATLRNVLTVPPSKLGKGQAWRFTIAASDGTATGTTVSSNTVTIQNSPPVATSPAITPAAPNAGDALTASYTYADSDSDAQSGSELRWFKNGVEQTALFGATTVPAGVTLRGERWTFSVRPRDGTDFGTPLTSPEVSIANGVPLVSSLSIQPSQPGTEDTLVASYTYLDADGDPETGSEIRWFRNGVEATVYLGLVNLPASATTKGESWYVTVKPRDGLDFGQQATSAPVLILNTPPRATNVNLSPLSPRATDALVASYTYVDPDDDAQQGTELRWFRNDTEVGSLLNQSIVPANTARAGETWYFTVRPKDGVAFGVLVTSTSVIVGSSAPVATALQITPFAPTTLDPLVANYLYSDPDGEPESGSELEWQRDGTPVATLTGSRTVPTGTAQKGESWSFSVRPKDGASFGARQTSAPVVIRNTPPAASSATVTPSQPRTDDVLTATFTYGDADGDPQVGSEIRWYRNGLEQPSLLDQPFVPASATRKREVWYYRVRPKDGTDYGPAEVSNPTFIENSPPVASAGPDQQIPPTQAVMRVTLDGTGSQDMDGDVLDYTWSEGSTVLSRGARVTVELPVGQRTLTLTVADGEDTSTDEVLIDIPDPRPTATAPADFTMPPGRIVLTGSGSDVLGRTPGYQWTQVAGAPVDLRDAGTATAWFLGTRSGTYIFELVATLPGVSSEPARTTVTIRNLPPWASAPARQVVEAGQELSLDGSGSDDPNADPLTWRWTVESSSGASTLADGDQPTARLTLLADGRYGVTLVVNDGVEDSLPAFTEVIAINAQVKTHPPAANAGPDGVGELGKPVTLEGRGSYDIDGDALTYSWRRVSGPADPPVPAHSSTPTFRATGAGTVVMGLTVSDGKVTSSEDTVTFEMDDPAVNRRPVARAGSDRSVGMGTEVQLDATRSTDPDGDVLTYQWTQLAGPRVTLDNNRSPRPGFTPTRSGFVRFGLTVSDGKVASAPSSVLIQVTTDGNSPPLASAGPDQQVVIGGVVTLDGSGSSDPDGNPLRYVWEQVWGSPVVLGSPGVRPAFTPPGQGRYRFRLTVLDGEAPSAADEVDVVVGTHGADNKPPVAHTFNTLEVPVGERVQLDGTESDDPDPLDKLTYEWTVSGFPTGSEPVLADSATATPSFTPTVAGSYTFRLRVSDGDLTSSPVYMTVLATSDSKGGLGCGAGSGAPLPLAAVLLTLLWSGRRRALAARGARVFAARALAVLLALGVAWMPVVAGAAVEQPQGKTRKKKPTSGKSPAGRSTFSKPATGKSAAGKSLSGKKKKKQPVLEAPVEVVPPPIEEVSPEPAQPVDEAPVTPETSAAPPPQEEAIPTEGPPNPYLEEARQLYLGFQFEGIIPKLEFALAVKGVTVAQKIEIYKLMALTHSAFDDAPKAEEAFLHILELQPDYELTGGASPKIRSYFASAQKAYRAQQAVKLQHAAPKPSVHGETTTVDVTVVAGADRVSAITLHYRPRGSTGGYSQLAMARGESGAFSCNVPSAFPGPAGKRTIEYFVRARDASGALLASVGAEETPLELTMETVELAKSQPLYKSWVFWTAVGVGTAAAIATPVLINRSVQVRPGSLGMEPLK